MPLQGHSLRSVITFNGQGVANIPILLFIPKSSKLTENDLNKFGCFKPPKPPVNFIPVNLKDTLNSDLACQVFILTCAKDATMFRSSAILTVLSCSRV